MPAATNVAHLAEEADTPEAGRAIARFAAAFRPEALGERELRLCGRSLADTLACAIGGKAEHAAQAALSYLTSAGLVGANGPCRLWGRRERAAPEIAAFWNGVAGHVLDYDDVTVPMRGHPSVVLWPALVALAEARGIGGARMAASFVVGLEVICALGRAAGAEQYRRGWHTTASIGVIGGTVACTHLLGLDENRIVHAIGLAVAQAAGSRENVGTEGKSFQAGHANGAAVRAACLAEAGFEAGRDALDGPHGLLSLYGQSERLSLEALGETPFDARRSGLDVKFYPMCYATHRALDAILDLRAAHDLTLDQVDAVHVETSRAALLPLVHPRPKLGLEGKFSLAYAMSAALADGAITLSSFTDDAVARPQIQAFFDRVTWRETSDAAQPIWAEVQIALRDGRRLGRRVEVLRGSAQNPLSDDELAAKLQDCLLWGAVSNLDPDAGRRLLQECFALGDGSAAQILDTLPTTSRQEIIR